MRRCCCLLAGVSVLGTAACASDSVAGPRTTPEPEVVYGLDDLARPREPGTVIIIYRAPGQVPVSPVPPLVLVDGAEWTESLDRIDARSMVAIAVLKGEAAVAAYGARAEAGVILITTRREDAS